MRIIRLLAVVGTTIAGLGLAGCSDDAAALSKPEFIEQANTLCQTAEDRITPLFDDVWATFDDLDTDDPAGQQLVYDRFDEAVDEAVPIWQEMVDDIRALGPPDEDEALIETLLDDLEAGIDEMQAIVSAAAAGDEEARRTMDSDEETDPLADVNRRAREYGLTVCGDES